LGSWVGSGGRFGSLGSHRQGIHLDFDVLVLKDERESVMQVDQGLNPVIRTILAVVRDQGAEVFRVLAGRFEVVQFLRGSRLEGNGAVDVEFRRRLRRLLTLVGRDESAVGLVAGQRLVHAEPQEVRD